jgi:hypothetical protein
MNTFHITMPSRRREYTFTSYFEEKKLEIFPVEKIGRKLI